MDDVWDLIRKLATLALLLLPWLIRLGRRGGQQERSAESKPTSPKTRKPPKPPAQPGPSRGPALQASAQTQAQTRAAALRSDKAEIARLLAAGEQLRTSLSASAPQAPLRAVLQAGVIDPLEQARQHPERDDTRARVQRVSRRLDALQRLIAARPNDGLLDLIGALERFADDLYRPLRELELAEGTGLLGGIPVIATRGHADSPVLVHELGLSPLAVHPGFGHRLSDWDALCRQVGERWFFELDGFSAETYQRLRLRPTPEGVLLPSPGLGYDGASVYACFAVWLPVLMAEVFSTLRLGAAHAIGARLRLRGKPANVAEAHGERLSREPPPLVIMSAIFATLEALGMRADAATERAAFERSAGDLSQARLPMQQALWLALDAAFLVDLTERVVAAVLGHAFECLDGFRLQEIPGFAHTAHERAVQIGLGPRLLGQPGQPVVASAGPVRLVAAALRLVGTGAAPEERALPALRRALSDAEQRPRARAAVRAADASLARAVRDRQAVIEAIILSEALSRRA